LELEAELGGVRRMARFLRIFPLALGLGLAAFFVVLFGFILPPAVRNARGNPPPMWLIACIPLLAVSPWPFVAPALIRMLTRRTVRALDTLLSNVAMAART
jgi:hypothetical protein